MQFRSYRDKDTNASCNANPEIVNKSVNSKINSSLPGQHQEDDREVIESVTRQPQNLKFEDVLNATGGFYACFYCK